MGIRSEEAVGRFEGVCMGMEWLRGVLGDARCSILDLYARMCKKRGRREQGDRNKKSPIAR